MNQFKRNYMSHFTPSLIRRPMEAGSPAASCLRTQDVYQIALPKHHTCWPPLNTCSYSTLTCVPCVLPTPTCLKKKKHWHVRGQRVVRTSLQRQQQTVSYVPSTQGRVVRSDSHTCAYTFYKCKALCVVGIIRVCVHTSHVIQCTL